MFGQGARLIDQTEAQTEPRIRQSQSSQSYNPIIPLFDKGKQNLDAFKMGRESQSNLDQALKTRLEQKGNPMADMGMANNWSDLNKDEKDYLARSSVNFTSGVTTPLSQNATTLIKSIKGLPSIGQYEDLMKIAIDEAKIPKTFVSKMDPTELYQSLKTLLPDNVRKPVDTMKNLLPKNKPLVRPLNLGDDLITEARKYGSAEEFVKAQTPSKDYVTVYHRTNTPVEEFGKTPIFSKENANEFFVSNKKAGQAEGYGKNVLELRVKKSDLSINDEFPSGEKHYTINTKKADEALKTKSQLTSLYNQAKGNLFSKSDKNLFSKRK
jgi:hypothetical protein